MRTAVSSISTILVPFIPMDAVSCLAMVMSSVSISIPFIPDLIAFDKRGVAYAWLGLVFIGALLTIFLIIEFNIPEMIELKWIYVSAGILGLATDLLICKDISDHFKGKLNKR